MSHPLRLSRRRNSRNRCALQVEHLESRQLLAGLPLGATAADTGEYFLGRVAVTPVLIESDGSIDTSTQDWSEAEIAATLAKVTEGVQWWADTLDQLDTVHSLEFVIDDSFATTPYESPFEPIDRPSDDYQVWISQFLRDVGHADVDSLEQGIREFNDAQRQKLDTDWSFTIFVAASDPNGQFAAGGSFSTAFALPGGLFFVSPASRPASTFAHETGHIFYALDEYAGGASAYRTRGYYDSQNLNAINNNPDPGFVQEPSIMSGGTSLQTAYVNHTSSAATLALVGWQDSDGDGIFDVLDVPLTLSGSGRFDSTTGTYRFQGSAAAQALPNQNSTGLQNDITLNEISRIEYRIDAGDWLIASQPNAQTATLDLRIAIDVPFNQIEIRAIDQQTGITSNLFTGSSDLPATTESSAAIAGHVWLDRLNDSEFDAADPGVADVSIQIVDQLGQPVSLIQGVEPDDYPAAAIPATPGVTLSAVGTSISETISASVSQFATTGEQVFAAFNTAQFRNSESWSSARDQIFQATFDEPVASVWIDATALASPSYARIEAYDASGELIHRITSDAIPMETSTTLQISTATRQIASIRAYGHAETSIALDNLRFGTETATSTDNLGTFSLNGLPDGQYRLEIESDRPEIYQVETPLIDIEVVDGVARAFAAVRVTQLTSPWQNPADRYDVNASNSIEPLDALQILNEINRSGSRQLTASDIGSRYYDVNGDGMIAPIDVLQILNELQRNPADAGEWYADAGSEPQIGSQTDGDSASAPFAAAVSARFQTADAATQVAEGEHEQATDKFFAALSSASFAGTMGQHPKAGQPVAPLNLEQFASPEETDEPKNSLESESGPLEPLIQPLQK
ncbi:dockerin type I domain-containing protein [Rosistilla oblonga]|uniref:dockerin type I domain-containing protein n=1 Tax=Rosistilla oblonga TaxID=2527990 RepID=UPI003A986EA6